MQVLVGSERVPLEARGGVLTIGNFDGLHRGHRVLVEACVQRARELGGHALVYTFEPHPRQVLQPGSAPPKLMCPGQLDLGLAELGADVLVREPFTAEFSRLGAEAFLRDVISARIAPLEIFVGRDFHFGRDRSGSGETLSSLAPRLGMGVHIIAQVSIGDEDVSSTRIRTLLAEGRVDQAARHLGRPYEVWGKVVHGDQRGRTLGFPTANLDTENELLPAFGVYAGRVRVLAGGRPAGRSWRAVSNVGTRPTFEPGRVLVETHLLDFDGDLYGQRLALGFEARIRPERAFDGPDALKRQIAADASEARALLGAEPA